MIMNNKLVRSYDRKIGGVCGGIAKFFDIDPTLVRVGYTLLTVFTVFSGVLAYIILWIIIPEQEQ
jgi:phage shock protein C